MTAKAATSSFLYDYISGPADRLSEYPHDFVLSWAQFDPAGLATITYVDERDDTRLPLSGGKLAARPANTTIISGKEDTSSGQSIFNVRAKGSVGRRSFQFAMMTHQARDNNSGGVLMASAEDEPMTKKAPDYADMYRRPCEIHGR